MITSGEGNMSEQLLAPEDLGTDHVPRFRDGVTALPVGEECVLFDEEDEMLHQLDGPATLVCELFDGETTVGEAVDDLAAMFAADRSVIESDVLEMLRDLGRKGLLEGVEPEPQTADPSGPTETASPS
jgi:hypothetical protein